MQRSGSFDAAALPIWIACWQLPGLLLWRHIGRKRHIGAFARTIWKIGPRWQKFFWWPAVGAGRRQSDSQPSRPL